MERNNTVAAVGLLAVAFGVAYGLWKRSQPTPKKTTINPKENRVVPIKKTTVNELSAGYGRDQFQSQCDAFSSLIVPQNNHNVEFFDSTNLLIERIAADVAPHLRQRISTGHLGTIMLGNALVENFSADLFDQFDGATDLLKSSILEACCIYKPITQTVVREKLSEYLGLVNSPFEKYRPVVRIAAH